MNIYDVAKMAGVSIATVSRVVNNSPKVSEKTKRKVLAVIESADYTPNVFARGLGLDSMKSVGILCPDIADDYMSKAVAVLEKRLSGYGYNCIVSCSGLKAENKELQVKLLMSKRIDVLIMVGSVYSGDGEDAKETDYIREAAKTVPVFMLNGYVEGDNIYCFLCEDFKVVYEVTSGFIRRGKKRILFLSDASSYAAKQKMAGYEAALIDAGYPVLGDLKLYCKNDIHYTRDMLLSYKNLQFDAVMAVEDGLAIGAIKYARIRGLSVPEDISVCGYNNSALAISCEPELTSVNNHPCKMCNDAVDLMIRLVQGETDIPKKISVPCTIEKRCTTDF